MSSFTRRERLIVLALAIAIFTGTLNVYLLTPFLKLIAADFGVSEAAAGQLSTTYAVAAGLVGLVVAPLVDRYQRRRLLYLAVTIIALATVFSAVAPSFTLLLAAHGLAGFGAAFGGSSCFAIASDAFPDLTKRNRCLGLVIAAGGASSVIGVPILTQIAAASSWRWAAAALLVPCAAATLLIGVLPSQHLRPRTTFVRDYLASYRRVVRNHETRWLYLGTLTLAMAEAAPLIYSASIWQGLFDLSLQSFGWIFLLGGICYAVGSNLAPVVLRRYPPRTVCIAAAALQMMAALVFPLANNSLAASLVIYGIFVVTLGALGIVALNVLLQDSLPNDRGAVLSLDGVVGKAGTAGAAIFGGIILAVLGEGAIIPVISLVLPFTLLAFWRSGQRPTAPALAFEPVETAAP
ncbi:MAG TPA: MFS transporter [Thermomicrobiaceae bacterium]|nr:MFS transporter [Thermomicrobiaceae bacterium]